MSRSIHANRSSTQYHQTGAWDWDAVGSKRSIKAGIRRQRDTPDAQPPVTLARDVPIRLVDEAPQLFFPAGVDDLRAVLEALPQGVTTGLEEIRLEIGRYIVNERERAYDMIEPSFGRKSVEDVPGVFVPISMGVYRPDEQTIRLFGYTKAPKLQLTRRQQIALELQMLATLVHEVIHHHDRMHRMGGGRSWLSYLDKTEDYTRRLTVRWVLDAVVPYLRRKYGEADTARLTRLVLRPRHGKRWRGGLSNGARQRRRRAALAALPARKQRWVIKGSP